MSGLDREKISHFDRNDEVDSFSAACFPVFASGQIARVNGPKPWDNIADESGKIAKWERESMRMKRGHKISVLALFCALAAGCGTKVNDQDAIRASIEKHLSGRADLNLSAMDREVKQVTINGDHASAQVEFRVKGGDAGMEIEYALERQGKEWTVLKGQPMGMDSVHPGMEKAPASGTNAGGGQLPQGHPAVN
jgi:hypothetical protein